MGNARRSLLFGHFRAGPKLLGFGWLMKGCVLSRGGLRIDILEIGDLFGKRVRAANEKRRPKPLLPPQ
jgi:hypothetical protein